MAYDAQLPPGTEDRFGFEHLLAELINKFVDLPADRVVAETKNALGQLLTILDFDRVNFVEISPDSGAQLLCSVASPDTGLLPLEHLPSRLHWYEQKMRAGEPLILCNLPDDFPAEARAERQFVQQAGIHACLLIPLRAGGKLFGSINFSSLRPIANWDAELVARLKMIGEVLASALAHCRVETSLHDVEQRLQQLRTELWRADRTDSASVLNGSLAHELNQPLAAILSNAQAALRFLDRGEGAGELREILEAIVREDRRAGAVIRGMRAMLRREEFPRAPVELAAAVEEVLASMDDELRGRRVQVQTQFEADCAVLADRTQIQQVVINLITNAIEAMASQPPSTRELALTITRASVELIKVSVRDSGVGMPTPQLANLFQPFNTSKEQGMGLGLAIARSIVEAHGGEIHAERNANRGLTFTIELPAPLAVQPTGASTTRSSRAANSRKSSAAASVATTVWIVDDDIAVQTGLRRLLNAAGYTVEAFTSPQDFMTRTDRQPAACMLLDVCMPDMSGTEFHAHLQEQGIDIPVVFLTGQADVVTGVEAMKRGAVDYLLKPVDDAVLIETVARAIGRYQLDEARRREQHAISTRLDRLSTREREVMDCVVRGLLNKQIAAELGIAETTVKQHRGRVMEKLETHSVAELVRLHDSLNQPSLNQPALNQPALNQASSNPAPF